MQRLVQAGVIGLVVSAAAICAAEITREEALALAFPGAVIRGERVFLTEDQRARAALRAGEMLPTALIGRYVATVDGRMVGRSYIDTNVVRTKKESLLVTLDADGHVKRIDVTAFAEPADYLPSDLWLRQYGDRTLDDELALNRAIRPIAGATLTARAVNRAVRRVLAIDHVLRHGDAR